MLTKAIESLIFRRLEDLTEAVSARPVNFNRLEELSASSLLLKNNISFLIGKHHLSCCEAHIRLNRSGRNRQNTLMFRNREIRHHILRQNRKTLLIGKLILRSCRNMDDLISQDLQTHKGRSTLYRLLHLDGNSRIILFVIP